MDIGTVSGVILAMAMMGGALVMMASHGHGSVHLSAFLDIPALMLVVGGSFAVALVGFPLKTALNAFRLMLKVFLNKRPHPGHLIEKLVKLAEVARRDGLLALERQVAEIEDKFMARAVSMAVDGIQPEVIQMVLNKEIDAMRARHLEGKKMIELVGRCGPAFGMIATLLGLVLMLGNLSDPDSIGPSMAVALVGTMYGALAANLVAIPFAEKLAGLSHEEALCREVILDGVLSIQSGDSPRVIQERLNAYLSPQEREAMAKHE